ncbi:hypothetical protein C5167_050785 [Papaver somniferum]|uniref:RecQ mediated genome instability protein 1 OB-fold domain-containing protein n=1 Tax=Papaver somniferum TaxID=3469 RepID=A0A4Y7KSG4_PAPSO|nr:tudor domain-containing protein 3 [Papaver somniferum]RZC75300.1 hypothetical protein C5167_050785 [Papaver somniferum]
MENTVSLLETLIRKGWCFRNIEEISSQIHNHISTVNNRVSADSIESELLLNMDLKIIGGKSLPDDRKSSYLHGRRVLQIVSVRDIYQSNIEASSGTSGSKRLLRLGLTDGYSQIVGIEYSQVPSIHGDIVPGTKVLLDNKVVMRNGILCLNPKVVTVLGGVVQSLYEEWEMSRKYSGFSRSSVKQSQKSGDDGPPAFEKLQIGSRPHQFAQQRSSSESILKSHVASAVKLSEGSDSRELGRNQTLNLKQEGGRSDVGTTPITGKTGDKPSSSVSRPKEVVEAVPVQNQAAAQKLLQKMSQPPTRGDRNFRGPRHKGKGREEEQAVLTLDEWERRKGGVKPLVQNEFHDISKDEELARQLQNQLDLEDIHAREAPMSEAEKIRMSMFSFEREEDGRDPGRMGSRGRGRGRGGKGRGRGKREFG